MSDKYRGKIDDKHYVGEQVDITFSLKRCVHAAACGRRLPAVFDVQKRPWVQPDARPADEIVAVVKDCPSGALHLARKDGGPEETPTGPNVIYVHDDAYLRIRGDLSIVGALVDIQNETRVTLCRCGSSNQKPFCDNTHREIGFSTESLKPHAAKPNLSGDGHLQVQIYPNGPIEIAGNFEIRDKAEQIVFQAENKKVFLCRCGASKSKPFCDQTHRTIGFEAE